MEGDRGAVSRSTALLTVALALGAVACQTPPPSAPPVQARASDPAVEAHQALERRDWAAAAPLLRQAIARDPKNLGLRYRLAICATQLDQWDEAIREFEWVLANAPAGAPEAIEARSWLVAAGLLSPAGATTTPTESRTAGDLANGDSGLSGRVILDNPGQGPAPQPHAQVHLVGIPHTPTADLRFTTGTDDDGQFEFKSIPAGPYRLTNNIAGPPIWRLKVLLESGQQTTLDLKPDNSIKFRDDFPQNP